MSDLSVGDKVVLDFLSPEEYELGFNKKDIYTIKAETDGRFILDKHPKREFFGYQIFKVEETDEATASPTGSLRYDKGKPKMSHLAPEFIMSMAELMTKAEEKYAKWNYAKGQSFCTALDSLERHLFKFKNGIDFDDETESSHLTHVAVCAMIVWCSWKYHVEKYPELDDRFKKVLGINHE